MDFVYLRALEQILKMSYRFIPPLLSVHSCLKTSQATPVPRAAGRDSSRSPDSPRLLCFYTETTEHKNKLNKIRLRKIFLA